MLKGVAVGLLTYGLFSSTDASVKALGGFGMPVFEINFMVTLITFVGTIGFAKPRAEKWSEVFHLNRPGLVLVRAFCGVGAGLCGVYAFTTLPLAEAYALLFLMPAFATVLSIPLLGEEVGWRRGLAVVAGFAGVLLVVRPGFRELHLGHLAAALAALLSALAMITLRVLGRTEKRVSVLAVVYIVVLVVNLPFMLATFRPISAAEGGLLLYAGLVGGIGQITMMIATKLAPANRVAPTQYSQIVWAVTYGALFFNEFPDWVAFLGMALVAGSGLFTFFREEQLHQWSRRMPLLRNRP